MIPRRGVPTAVTMEAKLREGRGVEIRLRRGRAPEGIRWARIRDEIRGPAPERPEREVRRGETQKGGSVTLERSHRIEAPLARGATRIS